MQNFLEYTDLGCWKDGDGQFMVRTFSNKLSNMISPPNIISKCLQLARAQGHILFALQAGRQCFGGPEDLSYQQHGTSTKCDNSTGTGGPWANQVYKIKGEIFITIY